MSAHGRPQALRLIDQLLTLAGPGAELIEASEREWASATFAGARHCVTFSVPTVAGETPPPAWLDVVSEHGFNLPRAFVADTSAVIAAPMQDADGQWRRICTVELLIVSDDVA